MTNHFSYENFDLTVNLQGTQGNKIYNLSRNDGNSGRGRLRGYTFNNNYWKSETDPGDGFVQSFARGLDLCSRLARDPGGAAVFGGPRFRRGRDAVHGKIHARRRA